MFPSQGHLLVADSSLVGVFAGIRTKPLCNDRSVADHSNLLGFMSLSVANGHQGFEGAVIFREVCGNPKNSNLYVW